MNDDDLLQAIREAGEVPPPPDRDGAFERAMDSIVLPGRSMRRVLTAFVAAALLVIPAGVFQTVGGLVEDPGSPDVVRPFTIPSPAADNANAGTSGDPNGDVASPEDRDDVLADPQPSRGQDDAGHQGKGEPCGPSDEKGGVNLDKRRGPCADE